MSAYDAALMLAPSLRPGTCVVCGDTHVTSHHVVPRSRGGHDGPQLHLCGHGTTGCHGRAEGRVLHFRWEAATQRWQYLTCAQPTKYADALAQDGWCYTREPR